MTDQQRALFLDMQQQLEIQGFLIDNTTMQRLEHRINEQVIAQADRDDHLEGQPESLTRRLNALQAMVTSVVLDSLPKVGEQIVKTVVHQSIVKLFGKV